MAKAIFHKNQRVYVKPVGTYAMIERVVPHWVKDVEEPLRVTYDVGLGREFSAAELVSEATMRKRDLDGEDDEADLVEHWRIFRMGNSWHQGQDASHHPHPGSFPVVRTDEKEWGGWRVPGAEYDRDPARIEHQARLIVNAPHMLRLLRKFHEFLNHNADRLPDEIAKEAKRCQAILRDIYDIPQGDAPQVRAAE